MDNIDLTKIKKFIEIFGDKVIQELKREKAELIQLTVERSNNIFYTISYYPKKPLFEIAYSVQIADQKDIEILSELIKSDEFNFEIRQIVTAPDILYFFNITDGKFQGFTIYSRIYLGIDAIYMFELAKIIQNILNYGILEYLFIKSKIESAKKTSLDPSYR